MLQDQVNEILAGQSTVFYGPGLAVDIPKSYLAAFIGDDVLFADHAFVQVLGKVFDGSGAFADLPTVDDPLARGRWNGKTAFAQFLQKAGAKDLGEVILFKQIVPLFLCNISIIHGSKYFILNKIKTMCYVRSHEPTY